ncbi:UxaA family hydrolase [Brevibacterium salitolerans]|uniref:SAF domain-containing protein n=1 Tax=Brevibacterium salitolerans TaxID=1403566 RepID=A0ABP5I5X8_9MICO
MPPTYILPTPEDNVAIVPERLEAGQRLDIEGAPVVLRHAVLQGHRICVRPVRAGEPLLSWGLPFGTALADLAPGDYVCNEKMREVLLQRNPQDFPQESPPVVNFSDRDTVAERTLPQAPVFGHNAPAHTGERTFPGYRRGPSRGWGTRNHLAVIGTTSRSRAAVLAAADELARRHPATEGFDGVVPVVHTEGGGDDAPLNAPLLVRTLAGFAVNPNVGAAIVVGDPEAAVSNRDVLAALGELPHSPHEYTVRFCLAADASEEAVAGIVAAAESVVERVKSCVREPAPLSALKVGMQCGGSDAFSGVSANQVLGRAMHTLIDHGGAVGLAETDELIGSEVFTLARVADASVTDRFLEIQQRFKDYAQAHGHTAEGNVSGGNIYRGLYNITLKSLGAARKKDPRTAIDHVIDYAEPMDRPGFYFMDSPGNDLESVAGQVASGANLIIFTTGNGSITNFPFVPTLKVVTTTARFRHLESDMDFNAGRILDGHSMDAEGQELFELAVATAGGQPAKGEASRQSQTQIWRSWHFRSTADGTAGAAGRDRSSFTGEPLLPLGGSGADARTGAGEVPEASSGAAPTAPAGAAAELAGVAAAPEIVVAGNRFDLVLPTSLCSGQVAEQIAARVTGEQAGASGDAVGSPGAGAGASGDAAGSSRGQAGVSGALPVVALSHTEGCGVSSGSAEEIFRDTLLGYATHPLTAHAVFLEHGCEKTHNDFFRDSLAARGVDAGDFDWASIQAEGGIARVTEHVVSALAGAQAARTGRAAGTGAPAKEEAHSAARVRGAEGEAASALAAEGAPNTEGGPAPLVGISTSARNAASTAPLVAALVRRLLAGGTGVLLAASDPVLEQESFLLPLGLGPHPEPTLPHAAQVRIPGLHLMDDSSSDWLETATGLGASGASVLVVFADLHPRQPHRFLPTVQVGTAGRAQGMDLVLDLPREDGAEGEPDSGGVAAGGTGRASDAALEAILTAVAQAAAGAFVQATRPRANVGFQVSRGRFGVSL